MVKTIDTVVIGAGVVGLAIARALAMAGHETYVLEKNPSFGQETSSRNSEVIHAGIYYPPGSLKAKLCRRGRDLLYAFCTDKALSHRKCGKLIVTTGAQQQAQLMALFELGKTNGVNDLEYLDQGNLVTIEAEIRANAALLSPSTGIVDSHELMHGLLADIEAFHGLIAFRTTVSGGKCGPKEILLKLQGENDQFEITAKTVINCGGHGAPAIAKNLFGFPREALPESYFAKGSYFSYQGESPFQHLVYPLPDSSGLGIHATTDLNGRTRFGPDVEWVSSLDFEVDSMKRRTFFECIQQYWEGVDESLLIPDYAGVRPKLVPEGSPPADFLIQSVKDHGVPGLINLFGIESPGLTACLAIGEYILNLTEEL